MCRLFIGEQEFKVSFSSDWAESGVEQVRVHLQTGGSQNGCLQVRSSSGRQEQISKPGLPSVSTSITNTGRKVNLPIWGQVSALVWGQQQVNIQEECNPKTSCNQVRVQGQSALWNPGSRRVRVHPLGDQTNRVVRKQTKMTGRQDGDQP